MIGNHENNTSTREGDYNPDPEQYLVELLEGMKIPNEYAQTIEAVTGRQDNRTYDHEFWLSGVGKKLAEKKQEADRLLAMVPARKSMEVMKSSYSDLHEKFQDDEHSLGYIADIIPNLTSRRAG